MIEDVISVEHFEVRYRVPRLHPAPQSVRHRLDHLVEHRLPGALEVALAAALAPLAGGDARDGVWVIRCLQCDLDIDAALPVETVTASWARALARTLVDAMQHLDRDVLRFDDEAAYLARYLVDRACDEAHDKWYYRDFDGLRMLPRSNALRTAILRDPATSHRALLRLSEPDRGRVIDAMSIIDLRRVLEALLRSEDGDAIAPGSARQQTERLRELVQRVRSRRWRTATLESVERVALELYLSVVEGGEAAHRQPRRTSFEMLVVMVALDAWCSHRPDIAKELIVAVQQGDRRALEGRLDAEQARQLEALWRWSAAARREVVSWLEEGDENAVARPEAGGVRYTPFGGLFMLLPLLDELPIELMVAGWPEPTCATARAWLAWLLLLKATGSTRSLAAFRDPLWRDLFGIAPEVTAERVREWLGAVPEDAAAHTAEVLAQHRRAQAERSLRPTMAWRVEDTHAHAALPAALCGARELDVTLSLATSMVLHDLACRLPGFAGSSPSFLYERFLDVHAAVETEPARTVVRLARAPLDVILGMTGLARARYRVDWLGERSFALFPEAA